MISTRVLTEAGVADIVSTLQHLCVSLYLIASKAAYVQVKLVQLVKELGYSYARSAFQSMKLTSMPLSFVLGVCLKLLHLLEQIAVLLKYFAISLSLMFVQLFYCVLFLA